MFLPCLSLFFFSKTEIRGPHVGPSIKLLANVIGVLKHFASETMKEKFINEG